VIALGTNEVPHFGGGAHWEEDGAGNREFEISDRDTNRQHQEEIAEKLAVAIRRRDTEPGEADITSEEREIAERLLQSGLREITEFGRAVHAEMDALLEAARRGISVRGCIVYTTTFPCHNCARHIVAAGITRVVFIEPYPKSKAGPLHEDSIAIAQSDPGDRVDFQPFVGVAPRRYLQLFDAGSRARRSHLPRQDEQGRPTSFCRRNARPVFGDLEPEGLRPLLPAYRIKELIALRDFDDLMSRRPTDNESSNGNS
jgi:deoxycytidylate deaminase